MEHNFWTQPTGVARCHIFIPKLLIWVNFGGSCKGKMLPEFMAIWSIFLPFGTLYGRLVYFSAFIFCTKKNLATLQPTGIKERCPDD
jgi:hypothetical protein